MSIIIDVTTRSGNGLPLRTLIKTMTKYGKELVESVTYIKTTKKGTVYQVTLHESVTPEIEQEGR
jgi:hypothetical protein